MTVAPNLLTVTAVGVTRVKSSYGCPCNILTLWIQWPWTHRVTTLRYYGEQAQCPSHKRCYWERDRVQTTSFNRDQTYHRTTAPVVKSRVRTRTDTSWDSNARSVFDNHHRCLHTHTLGQTTMCNTEAAVNLIFSGWFYPPAQLPWMLPIYSYGPLQCYGRSTPWPM